MAADEEAVERKPTLHLRNEPFEHGIIALSPASRLDVNNLLKLIIYGKSRKAYPSLSFSAWQKWATEEAKLDPRLAWMYFETFDLTSFVSDDRRLKFSKLCLDKSKDEIDKLRSKNAVRLLPFVLFLFLQQYGAISLRSNASSDIQWPGDKQRRRSNTGDEHDEKHSYLHYMQLQESQRIHFLSQALPEMLKLLTDPEVASSNASDANVTFEGAEALGFLFDSHGLNIAKMASKQEEITKSGFSKITRTFSPSRLATWLLDNIKTQYNRTDLPDTVEPRPLLTISPTRSVVARLTRRTLQWGDAHGIAGSSLIVHHCSNSYLYFLSDLQSLLCLELFQALSRFKGAERLLSLQHVGDYSSDDCTLHLSTATQPVLSEATHNLTLAPYHTYYGNLEEHMEKAHLLPALNLWDQPVCVIQKGPHSASFQLLPAEELPVFVIPFELPGKTQSNPCTMPAEYSAVRQRKLEVATALRAAASKCDIDDSTKSSFIQSLEGRFLDWLQETGNIRQIQDLINLEKEQHQGSRLSNPK